MVMLTNHISKIVSLYETVYVEVHSITICVEIYSISIQKTAIF